MSNYQEALEKMFYYNMMPNDITEEELKQCDKTMQELIDRATPKKVEWIRAEVICPKCESDKIIGQYSNDEFNFCPVCGQALDWSNHE